jgi:hypothetical protein
MGLPVVIDSELRLLLAIRRMVRGGPAAEHRAHRSTVG